MKTARLPALPDHGNSRLRGQGFVNLYRKPLVILAIGAALAYLYLVPNPWRFHDWMRLAAQICGTILVFAGIIGRASSTLTIGGRKDREIVATEFYSVCRNPLYFSSFLMALGLGVISARPDFALLAAIACLAVFHPMIRNEEAVLRANFPDFDSYASCVPRFIPDFTLWIQRDRFEVNFKLFKRTLLDASVALLAIPVILAAGTLS